MPALHIVKQKDKYVKQKTLPLSLMMKKEYYLSTTSLRTVFYYCIEGDTVETITIHDNIGTTIFAYSNVKARQFDIDEIADYYIKIQPGPFKMMMQALNWFRQWLAANKLFDSYEEDEKRVTLTFGEYKLMLYSRDKHAFSFNLTKEKSCCEVKLPPQIYNIRELIAKIIIASNEFDSDTE